MSLTVPARRRGRSRARRALPPGVTAGSEHVATSGRRVYVVAYHRPPGGERRGGGAVTTFADHDTAPTRVVLAPPGPGAWLVSVLERGRGRDGFAFEVALDAVPLQPA